MTQEQIDNLKPGDLLRWKYLLSPLNSKESTWLYIKKDTILKLWQKGNFRRFRVGSSYSTTEVKLFLNTWSLVTE